MKQTKMLQCTSQAQIMIMIQILNWVCLVSLISTQSELNDLVRERRFVKTKAELLGSRLQGWCLLSPGAIYTETHLIPCDTDSFVDVFFPADLYIHDEQVGKGCGTPFCHHSFLFLPFQRGKIENENIRQLRNEVNYLGFSREKSILLCFKKECFKNVPRLPCFPK